MSKRLPMLVVCPIVALLSCDADDEEKTCPSGGPYGYVMLAKVADASGAPVCATGRSEPAGELVDDQQLSCDRPLYWKNLYNRRDVVVTLSAEHYEDWKGTIRAPACDEAAYTVTARMKLLP